MFNLKKKKLIPLLVVISFLIFLALSIIKLNAPLLDASKYPLGVISTLRRELGGIFFYHRNLVEYERLKRESGLLKQKLNALNEISLENARLKNILYFKQKSALKFLSARVIARCADNWSSGLIIDKGSGQGIRKGQAALTYLGLIGRVVETTDSTGKIMLLSDPNLGVSSLIQRSRQEGLVCGTLGPNLIMKYLPENADIKLQDTVVSSGLNSAYPKGLLIGEVVDIGREFSGLSRYAVIKPAVKLSDIEEVLVLVT